MEELKISKLGKINHNTDEMIMNGGKRMNATTQRNFKESNYSLFLVIPPSF